MITNSSTIHRLDLDGADRLTAVLMRAFAIGEGVDPLNPQGTQLQSLGPSLEHLFQDLRREIAALSTTGEAPQPGQGLLCQALERLSAQVAHLMQALRASAS